MVDFKKDNYWLNSPNVIKRSFAVFFHYALASVLIIVVGKIIWWGIESLWG